MPLVRHHLYISRLLKGFVVDGRRPSRLDRLGRSRCPCTDPTRKLVVSAQGVRELHLRRALAFGAKKPRAHNEDTRAAGAAGGNVQAIRVVQEVHTAGRVIGRRRSHRIDHNRGLLSLELIHRPYPSSRYPLSDCSYLCVVRGNNQDVSQRNRVVSPVRIGPGGSP